MIETEASKATAVAVEDDEIVCSEPRRLPGPTSTFA